MPGIVITVMEVLRHDRQQYDDFQGQGRLSVRLDRQEGCANVSEAPE